MIPLTNEENQSYHEQNTCYVCKKEFMIGMKLHLTNTKK